MTTKAKYEALADELEIEIRSIDRRAQNPDATNVAVADYTAEAAEKRAIARACRIAAAAEEQEAEWQDIATAPKDGTRILIWFVHPNAKYSANPIGDGWAGAHVAHWIDHNGGGWTWHGLAGKATLWRPMPAPPAATIRALKKGQG